MDKERLLPDDLETESPLTGEDRSASQHQRGILTTLLTVNAVLLAICAIYLAQGLRTLQAPFDQSLYSPAQDVVRYQHTIFTEGFGDEKSKYQGPPNEGVDDAWEDLYQFGVSRINRKEASQLVNKTSEIPGDRDHYITALDVFHQLHCLNMVRRAVWPEYYHLWNGLTELQKSERQQHLSHCVDTLRQSIMCFSDISTLYWEWMPAKQETYANARTTHVCRDFDAIKQWAMEHQMVVNLDTKVHLEGAPENLRETSFNPHIPG